MLTSLIITLSIITLFAGAIYALGQFIGKNNFDGHVEFPDYLFAGALISAGMFVFCLLFIMVNFIRMMIGW